ncbi:MAG: 6-carboxytetrahydropterin synthase [Actinobacteria bacterium]|nr:6-carboxytetrahydropterin synthase [Actinomycetota bacterium]
MVGRAPTPGAAYRLEAAVGGELDQRGVVQDFAEIGQVVQPLIDTLDHCDLGTVVDNPTA